MRRIAASFAVAVVLLGGFLFALGPARLADRLAGADLAVFALGLLAVLLALGCWSEATRVLFRSSGARLSPRRSFVAYGTGAFGKQVLPMGNAGGPAVMAYAYDRETRLGYSRSLAVIVVAELLSLAASILLGLVGVVVLVAGGATGGSIRWLALGMAVVGVVVAALSAVVWYRRAGVTAALASGAGLLRPTVARVAPGVASRLDPDRVTSGLERYYATVESVVADRRALLRAALLTQLGWVLFAVPLVTAALSLGVRLPLALAAFLVPAAGLATLFPLPGGLGGLEIVLAAVLGSLATLELAEAGAIVVAYRLCSFWFFVGVGGSCALAASASVPELVESFEAPVAALEESAGAADDESA